MRSEHAADDELRIRKAPGPDVVLVFLQGVADYAGQSASRIEQAWLLRQCGCANCTEQLTGYKKPKYIRFKKELPKTNVGKVLRRELRDLLSAP